MSDPYLYTYPSPLEGYQGSEPLPQEKVAEGPDRKSYINPPAKEQSKAYSQFTGGITNGTRGGFDIHIYFLQTSEDEKKFATELHERVRREFPELRTYSVFDRPVGPHPIGMFEVNLFNPQQFGAFIPWLVINRGPLSALIHPNTGDAVRDHSQRATWMGQPIPLHLETLRKVAANGA